MKITTTLATCTTPDGSKLVLQEHDGQFFLKVGGVQLMSTTALCGKRRLWRVIASDSAAVTPDPLPCTT